MRRKQSKLIGIDRRGGKGYKETECIRCGGVLYIGKNSEEGTCTHCAMIPKVKYEEAKLAVQTNNFSDFKKKYRINELQIETLKRKIGRYEEENSQQISNAFMGIDEAIEQGTLDKWRTEHKISQEDIANVFGISLSHYRRIESGKREISRRLRTKIAHLAGQVEKVSNPPKLP